MLTYQRIKQTLSNQLRKRYRPGERLPPIMQLAAELRLGKTNTHRAVRELVRDGLLVSRPGQGTFLRDPLRQTRIDPLAVHATALSGMHVGLICFRSTEPMMDPCAHAAAEWLEALGADTTIASTDDVSIEDLGRTLARMPDVAGLILLQADLIDHLPMAARTPTVLVSSSLPQGELRDGRFDIVTPDSYQAALLAGRHLKRCRCDTYAYVGVGTADASGGVEWDDISAQRLRGFEHGLTDGRKPQCVAVKTYEPDRALRGTAPMLRKCKGVLGIFGASDDLALGVALAAVAQGRRLGRDLHVVGFDGQRRGREFPEGPLSTLDLPTELMGIEAARRLAQRLLQPDDPPRHVQLPCSFFQGATSRERPKTGSNRGR